MSRLSAVFPASLLLLSFSLPSSGQTLIASADTGVPNVGVDIGVPDAGVPDAGVPDVGVATVGVANVGVAEPPRMGMPQAQLPAVTDPSVITVRPELTDEQLGDLYMVRKDYREAAIMFKRLSDASPRNAVYFNKLGISLHQQGALTLAIKCYERAIKLDPLYADAENNIGTVWYQRKRYAKAIRAYQKAINVRKDMPVLYSNMAYAYFEDKKYDKSLASFHQALVLDPKFFEQNGSRTGSVLQDRSVDDRGRFYFLLAKSFAAAGNLERCVIYLRKAKDEGFTALEAAKADPVLAALLIKYPEVQEAVTPKPSDGTVHFRNAALDQDKH